MADPQSPLFGLDPSELSKSRPGPLLIRFAFGAAISVVAGLAGKAFGSEIGGALLAFPAILPAALTLVEKDEGHGSAVHDIGGAVFGGIGLIAFAAVGAVLLGTVNAPLALLGAMVAWVVVSLSLYVVRATETLPLPGPVAGRSPGLVQLEERHNAG